MEVYVLRLGHRPDRDKRISTHVALTARALGAKGIYFSCFDVGVFDSVRDVVSRWGGDFFIEEVNWRKLLMGFDGIKVHLTMYGIPLPEKLDEIKKAEKLLVVVGAEKVPAEIYELCDYNISIGNQPHSEVAALAIFLDRILDKTFDIKFEDAKLEIVPSERRKVVRELKEEKAYDDL
jgi:tRNA (cytidine56-2'-O)-methyltransferase